MADNVVYHEPSRQELVIQLEIAASYFHMDLTELVRRLDTNTLCVEEGDEILIDDLKATLALLPKNDLLRPIHSARLASVG